MICTFIGHRNIFYDIEENIIETLRKVIIEKNIKTFYLGNNGQFDKMVLRILTSLSKEYDINYYVVYAYIPTVKKMETISGNVTIVPDGIEKVPKKFAINYRNMWMIKKSDYLITYIDHTIGSCAANYVEIAKKKGKRIIYITAK